MNSIAITPATAFIAINAQQSFTATGNDSKATAQPSSSALNNATFILYILDSGKALVLEDDSARILTGVMTRQY